MKIIPRAHKHLVQDLKATVGVLLRVDEFVVVAELELARVVKELRGGLLDVDVVCHNNDL